MTHGQWKVEQYSAEAESAIHPTQSFGATSVLYGIFPVKFVYFETLTFSIGEIGNIIVKQERLMIHIECRFFKGYMWILLVRAPSVLKNYCDFYSNYHEDGAGQIWVVKNIEGRSYPVKWNEL